MPENGNTHTHSLHESVYSLAWKIILLQILTALAFIVTVLVLFYIVPVADTNPPSLLVVLFGTGLQTFDAAMLIYLVLQWRSTRYQLTLDELVIYHGIADIKTSIYKLANIAELEVHQSLLGKFFNYGTVSFLHPALNTTVALFNIPNPWFYANLIEQAGSK